MTTDAGVPAGLRFTNAEPLPATIPTDLRALLQLPESARATFGEILGPFLQPKVPDDGDRLIEAYCRRYDTVGNHVALALRGARFVIWEAAKADASTGVFVEELGLLTEASAGATLGAVLAPIYETSRDRIRSELLRRSVADHGTIVVGIDWRLDRVVASQHAQALQGEVAVLTFSCREGAESKRTTLQLDRGMLVRLKRVCDRLLEGH